MNHKLSNTNYTNDTGKYWQDIKKAFEESNENFLQRTEIKTKETWMTEEILELMEKRRICKINKNNNEYKYLQRRIRKEIRLEKEKWLTKRCIEAENLSPP